VSDRHFTDARFGLVHRDTNLKDPDAIRRLHVVGGPCLARVVCDLLLWTWAARCPTVGVWRRCRQCSVL